jgi:hypothetical protein
LAAAEADAVCVVSDDEKSSVLSRVKSSMVKILWGQQMVATGHHRKGSCGAALESADRRINRFAFTAPLI